MTIAVTTDGERERRGLLFDSTRERSSKPRSPKLLERKASTAQPRTGIFGRRKAPPANTLAVSFGDDDHLISYEVAEQMRLLMARADLEDNVQTLAITSTIAGEGTTFVARSLAGVLAHDSALSVCLLEFNWEADEVRESVEAVAVLGLDENGERQETGKELTMICSGRVAPLQRSRFATSNDLAEDIESMRSHFDIIILDLPAVGGHSGVLSLGAFADTYILVARQGAAPTANIRAAIDDLGSDRIAGVVLNQVSLSAPSWLTRFARS